METTGAVDRYVGSKLKQVQSAYCKVQNEE